MEYKCENICRILILTLTEEKQKFGRHKKGGPAAYIHTKIFN